MRPDDINPRTGLIVALCSVSLVFGFMFTVSGIKGETLGDIPLIAIGPAICLPGLAAILLAKKTDGCTKCPFAKCCARKRALDKENSELLKPSWDMESGKGSRDGLDGPDDSMHVRSGEDSVSSTTTVGESRSLIRRVDENEVLRYLEACYPSNVFSGVSSYCALDQMCIPGDSIAYTATRNSVVYIPRDSIVVFSRRESSPYGTYCCYINPGDFTWGHETVV